MHTPECLASLQRQQGATSSEMESANINKRPAPTTTLSPTQSPPKPQKTKVYLVKPICLGVISLETPALQLSVGMEQLRLVLHTHYHGLSATTSAPTPATLAYVNK